MYRQSTAPITSVKSKSPAPGFALVFLTDNAFSESTPQSTQTFPTTVHPHQKNTATIDPAMLATSTGWREKQVLSSTSKESAAAPAFVVPSVMTTLLAITVGVMLVGKHMMW